MIQSVELDKKIHFLGFYEKQVNNLSVQEAPLVLSWYRAMMTQ